MIETAQMSVLDNHQSCVYHMRTPSSLTHSKRVLIDRVMRIPCEHRKNIKLQSVKILVFTVPTI